MTLRNAIAVCAKEHPEFVRMLTAELRVRHAHKWGNTDSAGRVASSGDPLMLTPMQRKFVRGPGKHLDNAWRKGEVPAWGYLAAFKKDLEALQDKFSRPGWEDSGRDDELKDLLDKLDIYIRSVYPTGKPVAPKKTTPNAVFLEQMQYPEVKALIDKFSRIFKGKPAEAGQFAYDVLEDANFHRDGGNMNVAMADYSGTTREAPSSVAMKLDWSSLVLPFAVGLVASAGDKRGATQMLKAFVQNNKQWLTEQS